MILRKIEEGIEVKIAPYYSEKELARAYFPMQKYKNRWNPVKGWNNGTIFPELYRPYLIGHYRVTEELMVPEKTTRVWETPDREGWYNHA